MKVFNSSRISRSDLIVKRYPDGTFTTGRTQAQRKDRSYQPLRGIASHETFYGLTKVSIPDRNNPTIIDIENLKKISLDFERDGNLELSEFFANKYASELLSGNHFVENSDNLISENDDFSRATLGLSDVAICHNPPPKILKIPAKRGSKGITIHGKRRIRCACALLEKKYTRKCLSFLTATLPAFSNASELRLICENWSYLIRAFIQELKRILERRGYPTSMVWVSEIQEERYQKSGDVAPHLHLVMVGKRTQFCKGWAIGKDEVRSLWERILGNLLGREITCIAATRIERPRKSLQGEMSSYLSKGDEIIEQIIEDGKGDHLPKNYSGCSDNLKKAIDKQTEILTGQEADDFINNLENMKQAGLLFYKPIIIYAHNLKRDITVGFVGWEKEPEIISQYLKEAA